MKTSVSVILSAIKQFIRKSLTTTILTLIIAGPGFTQETIRIMPLGNSITYGNMCVNGTISDCVPISGNDAPAYRYRFYELMAAAGWNIRFVGSENSGSNYLTDTKNAGFGGISDDNLATLMETGTSSHTGYKTPGPYLEGHPADIILLHIGTNDVLGADTSNVNGLERILDAIDDYETSSGNSVMVFLARIISYRDSECNTQPRVVAYNSKVDQLAASRIAAGDNLILVDMECGASIDYSSDMVDEVHPNQSGYDKMGEKWFQEVDSYLRSIYITYTITASAGQNGSVDPSGTLTVNEGDDQVFTITPDPGYKISDVLVDGSSEGAISEYNFTNITQNHTISASFEAISYEITTSVEGSGTITPSGTVIVNEGEDQSFSISADQDHKIKNVLVNGSSVGALSSYEFTDVFSDQTIHAIFEPITHVINASAGENGNIDPAGQVVVNQGSDQVFTFMPDEGYEVADIMVDGNSSAVADSYTFTGVTKDHSIEVSFRIKSYEISTSISGNGIISPAGPLTLEHGSGQSFIFTPDNNYEISDVRVNGNSVGVVDEYVFENVTSDQSLEVIFESITHTIIASAGTNGTIEPSGQISVNRGSDQGFSILPDEGYEIDEVVVDGSSAGNVQNYTFTNVSETHTIAASFRVKTYRIATSIIGEGSIDPEGPVTAEHGSDQTFSFTPADGYKIADILLDDLSIGKFSVYTLSDIVSDHSISAVFEFITSKNQTGTGNRPIHSVYPNPSNGEFTVHFNRGIYERDKKIVLRMMDITGRVVFLDEFDSAEIINKEKKQISLKPGFEEGIYYLEMIVGEKRHARKIVIRK